jgi:hypothetical protein
MQPSTEKAINFIRDRIQTTFTHASQGRLMSQEQIEFYDHLQIGILIDVVHRLFDTLNRNFHDKIIIDDTKLLRSILMIIDYRSARHLWSEQDDTSRGIALALLKYSAQLTGVDFRMRFINSIIWDNEDDEMIIKIPSYRDIENKNNQ